MSEGNATASSASSHRLYYATFAALALLTVAEVGVVYVPGIARSLLIAALVLLAVAKAGLVLMVFMHLSHERRALKLSIIVPFLLPAIYAAVLIGDAMWRPV